MYDDYELPGDGVALDERIIGQCKWFDNEKGFGFITCKDVHWFYFFMNELIEFHNMPTVEGITIHCDDTLRPKDRDDKMTRYQDKNVNVERFKIKKKYIEIMINSEYPPQVSLSGNMYFTCTCIWRPDGVALKRCDKHTIVKPKWMI